MKNGLNGWNKKLTTGNKKTIKKILINKLLMIFIEIRGCCKMMIYSHFATALFLSNLQKELLS